MTIGPSTRLILDSNEYIFGLGGGKTSCMQLLDRFEELQVWVPLMVVREVERNLKVMYGLGSAFFRLIAKRDNVTIIWSPRNISITWGKISFGAIQGRFTPNY